jgi:hypothetical protein
MHATNTIAEIVYQIKKATKPISLQRVSNVLVEKKFAKIRMHAGVHQTVNIVAGRPIVPLLLKLEKPFE